MTVRLNVPTFECVECVPMHVSIWGYKLGGDGGAEGEVARRIKGLGRNRFWFLRVGDALRVDDSRFESS